MSEILEALRAASVGLSVRDAIDVLIVAAITYWLLSLIEGTTAVALLRGIALVFVVGFIVSHVLGLTVLGWLLRNAIPALLVAIPILFQPELRRALEQIGRAGGLTRAPMAAASRRTIEVICETVGHLAERNWGAIIVLERQIPLGEYADTGIRLDSALSPELLLNIFFPHAPLHDGAVTVRGDRILAAGCVLPLADTIETGHEFGTRHRAAIGITAKTDALSVVVSEETGRISVCNNGRIVTNLDPQRLRRVLEILYRSRVAEAIPFLSRLRVLSRTP